MKRLLIASAFFTLPIGANAQTVPTPPTTLEIPTADVSALLTYLAQRPYTESAGMISELQGCVRVQIPAANGAVVSHGECPAVTSAMQDRAKELADAKAPKATPDAATKPPAPEGK